MDGNRRYAREKGLPTLEGHKQGLEKIKEVATWAQEAGVKEMTFFVFSNENWNRSPEEVSYLMDLFSYAFSKWIDELIEKGFCIRFIGDRERPSAKILKIMEDTENRTKDGSAATLIFAFSYGGREEILTAVNTLLAEDREQITEEDLRSAMWSKGLSDPDLIIRTSGEQRLSGFLTFQSVYSELFFTKTYWPALERKEFDEILENYALRDRRHGK